MTQQSDIINDAKYRTVLDHGFVGLVDYMGSDQAVVQAARTSYGNGTTSVRADRALIRYLMKHKHTSPFEMNVVKIHIKCPIFVMRQLVRHRTASLNEYSGRYSVMTDEFYVPELEQIKPQSKDNKQGRNGELILNDASHAQDMIRGTAEEAYAVYQNLLGENNSDDFSSEFDGIAREIARVVLPVSNYTELYWTQNLHNLFHLLRLRMDPHAQFEIRVLAEAIYDIVQPLYPECVQAFEDYIRTAESVSGPEKRLLAEVIALSNEKSYSFAYAFQQLVSAHDNADDFAEAYGLGKRELGEFTAQWNL